MVAASAGKTAAQNAVSGNSAEIAHSQPILAAGIWELFNFLGFGANVSDEKNRTDSIRQRPVDPGENEAENQESGKSIEPSTSSALPCTFNGATINVAPGGSIQSAINSANPAGGDRIVIAAGTYTEQLMINKCVRITGAGQAATIIQSPATLMPSTVAGVSNTASIVEIRSNSYVEMSGLTITGPVPFTYTVAGVFVNENSVLKMNSARVTAIHKASGIDGAQSAWGVLAGSAAFNQLGFVDFDTVTIDDYEKNGIMVGRTGSDAQIKNSIITGAGDSPAPPLAQNGIVIRDGATSTITNNTITNNICASTNCSFTGQYSFGVILLKSGTSTVSGNTFNNNDAGVYAWTPGFNSTVSGNKLTQTKYSGIYLDEGTANVNNNFVTGSNFGPVVGIGVVSYEGNTVNSVADIKSNSVTGASQSGIELYDENINDSAVPAATAEFNRIAGNVVGINKLTTTSTLTQSNNFWGCNTGPNTTGCDTASPFVDVTTPYLILSGTTANPTAVNPGGQSAVSGTNLRFNSAGTDTYTLPGNPHVPDGIVVTYTGNLGTVNPASTTLVNGSAASGTTFTADAGPFSGNQTGGVTAAVDNAQDTAVITINDIINPTVTINQKAGQPDPANNVPVEFTAVFSEVVTGFDNTDVSITGVTYSSIVVTDSGDGKTYNVAVTPTSSGVVTATIPAGAALDPANNPSAASTSTDNQVTFFTGAIEFVVDDGGVNCLNNGAPVYTTIQAAVAAANPGYIIRVCSGTYPLASTVNVPLANLTIIAAEPTKPLIQVGGTMDGFNVTATGVTLQNLEILKIGTGDQHHMVRVQANNFTGQSNYIHGPSWQTPNHVSRAYVFNAGVTGFLIDNNLIENLRQPAYTTGGSGTASNNTWTGTKGWVNDGGLITFTNNTMTTCAACDTDIALFNNANPAYQTFYADRLALSNANNNAHIDVQFTPANDSGRAVSYVATTGSSTNDGRVATPYASIQQAIFNPTAGIVDGTLPGGTVNVAAGTYAENVDVSRKLNILGPNAANNPITGTRVGEAVIFPATSDPLNVNTGPTVVSLTADGVVFKGFTVDGNNPALASGVLFNGSDVDAAYGIYGTETVNPDVFINNNIIQNIGEFGVFITSNSQGGAKNANSSISANKVDNILGAFGQGIRISDDAWVSVLNNAVTRVRNGIVIENFGGNSTTHPASLIDGNTVSSFRIGIRHNLHYTYTTPGFTISNNSVTSYLQSVIPAPLTSPTAYQGIRIESIQQNVIVNVSNNTVTGNRGALTSSGYMDVEGIRVTNSSTTSPNISITGNSVSDTKRGLMHTAPAIPTATCNNFFNNEVGVYVGYGLGFGNTPEQALNGINLNNNNILGNSLFGVQTDTAGNPNPPAPVMTNAQGNYWGASDGPGPVGPGSGDKVSANTDFSGFLTAPTNCSPVMPPPTVSINQATGQEDPTDEASIEFDVVFSEPVTDFETGDVVLSGTAGATTATVTQLTPSTYTVAVTGMTSDGTVIATIPAGAATGANGANVASTSMDNIVTYDMTAPKVVSINRADPNPTMASTVRFTVTFSEDVTGVTVDDFTPVPTGTVSYTPLTSGNISGSGSVYTITVTGITGDGTLGLNLTDNDSIQDLAGSSLVGMSSNDGGFTGQVYDIDMSRSSATVSDGYGGNPTNTAPITFTVTFGENVTGFGDAPTDVTVVNGTVTNISPASGPAMVYTVTVSPNGQGAVSLTVNQDAAVDSSNNGNAASNTDTVIYDTIAPTVTINQGSSQIDPTSTSPITFDAVFSEPVTNFTASDVSTAGSSAFGAGSPMITVTPLTASTYSVTIGGMTQSGTVTASIPAGAATDGAGNQSAASTSTDNTVFYNYVVGNPTNNSVSVNPTNTTATFPNNNPPNWFFLDESSSGGSGTGTFVNGPTGQPAGVGSVRLTVNPTGRYNVATQQFAGIRLADFSDLQYSTYQNNASNQNAQSAAISLQFDVDDNLSDTDTHYQGRLVFEPYQTPSNTVQQNIWQNWNTLQGRWWASSGSGLRPVAAACPQSNPCTTTDILNQFPNIGVRFLGANNPANGAFLLRAGGPVAGGFDGNADKLIVGINGNTKTFDFEPTPPTLWISDASVTEGNTGDTPTMTFTVTQSAISNLPTTVVVTTSDNGSAVAGNDYVAKTQTVTIPAGSTTTTFDVTVNGDVVYEGNETFTVTLSNPTNAVINIPNPADPTKDGTGTGTIIDDEAARTVSIALTSAGSEPNTPNVFTVTLSGQTAFPVTVDYATGNGSATAGSDYAAQTGTVTFAANTSTLTQTINVATLDDAVNEASEDFTVVLSNAVNAAITGTNPATGTIADNDSTVQFNPATYTSADNTANSVTVTVTRTGVLTAPATVNYATGGGTATGGASCAAGIDYINASGTLNFPANSGSQTFNVQVCSDSLIEGNETVNLTLSNPSSPATLGMASTAVLTISDGGTGSVSISGIVTQNNVGKDGVTVTLTGTNVGTVTTVTANGGNYSFNGLQGGNGINYLVTPSLSGFVFEPVNRSYTNLAASVTDANFVAYPAGSIPRNLTIGNVTTAAGATINVPVTLTTQTRTERNISFTIDYDETKVAPNAAGVVCSPGLVSPTVRCSVNANVTTTTGGTNQVLAVSITLANGAITSATTELIRIPFTTAAGVTSTTPSQATPLLFTDNPTRRRVFDGTNEVPSSYTNGQISINNVEADVTPRSTGDGFVDGSDAAKIDRFAVGLDLPLINNEFQRADCSPIGTRGDGFIDGSDAGQADRFAAGLDPLQPAGGPTGLVSPLRLDGLLGKSNKATDSKFSPTANSDLKVVSTVSSSGATKTVVIAVTATGNENGFGFSLAYDPTKLSLPSTNRDFDINLGSGAVDSSPQMIAPNLTVNTVNSNTQGKIGIGVRFPVNRTIKAGTNVELLRITFKVSSNVVAGEVIPISFTSDPARQIVYDVNSNSVTDSYADGAVTITGASAANVTVGGKIVDAKGNGIAGASVTLTDGSGQSRLVRANSFGNYQFSDVRAGETYFVRVGSKKYRFTPDSRTINVNDNLADVDFTADN